MRATGLAIVLAAAVALAGACTGHYTVIENQGDGLLDAGVSTCSGALYDPCTENSQCMSGNCKDYRGAGITVCTEACSGLNSNSCPPDSTGSAGFCNNMGLCKPTVANTCMQ